MVIGSNERILATAMVAVVILGTAAYRYYAITDARKAEVQIGAARLGTLLLEG